MNEITRNPLCWPDSVPRTAPHFRSSPGFKERTLAIAADFVRAEINRLNNRWFGSLDESVIISSNLKLKLDGSPYIVAVGLVGITIALVVDVLEWVEWNLAPLADALMEEEERK